MNLGCDSMMSDGDLAFGSHGNVFEKSLALTHKVTDLDISNAEGQGDLGCYCFNEEIGLWEWIGAQIGADDCGEPIKVEADSDHFSWYSTRSFPNFACNT
ncbi:MAG: hypothetical protein JSV84_01295 [Gemmatimonadota bacterium]|nr:MAG: hypothetical protein JSV84_01295 [Gemmatimonadota bacterium]